MDGLAEEKQRLRQAGIAAREALDPACRAAYSLALCERIRGTEAWRQAKTVLLYAAVRAEADLSPLVPWARQEGKRLLWPVCAPGRRK